MRQTAKENTHLQEYSKRLPNAIFFSKVEKNLSPTNPNLSSNILALRKNPPNPLKLRASQLARILPWVFFFFSSRRLR